MNEIPKHTEPAYGDAMTRVGDICPRCNPASTDLVDYPMYNADGSKLCRRCGGLSVPHVSPALNRIAVALERLVNKLEDL